MRSGRRIFVSDGLSCTGSLFFKLESGLHERARIGKSAFGGNGPYERAFYVSIPNELIEAAWLDGCGEIRTLLLGPMLFLYNETLFPLPYALYAFQTKFATDYSLLSAAMLISLLPLVIVYLFFQRSFQSGLLGGSIKG